MTTATDRVFVALADPTRRQLLEIIHRQTTCSASALARELPVSRQAIVKHLAVLAEADLVGSERRGREIVFDVRPETLVATASWMTSLAATWDARLTALKAAAEAKGHEAAVMWP
jgi:DNA-binding transcriptional ArsR family regulator